MTRNTRHGYHEIAKILRAELLARPWVGGAPFPTQDELRQRFVTTQVTLQRAMDQLQEDGFIVRRRKAGSVLAARPPHLFNFAVIYPGHPESVLSWRWSRHFLAVHLAAQELNRREDSHCKPYFDVQASNELIGAGFRRLAADAARNRLAGGIFPFAPHTLIGAGKLAALGLKIVTASEVAPEILCVPICPPTAMAPAAITYLTDCSRRRLAVLSADMHQPEAWLQALAAAGVVARPEWVLGVNATSHIWLRHALQLLLRGSAATRPNGLIINDDHLAEAAVAILLEMGLRLPEDVQVISHWNFPVPYHGAAPIARLGPDAGQWLAACIAALRSRQSAGVTAPVPMSLATGAGAPASPGNREAPEARLEALLTQAMAELKPDNEQGPARPVTRH